MASGRYDWESGTEAAGDIGARVCDWEDEGHPARRARMNSGSSSDTHTEYNSNSEFETAPESELLAYLISLLDERSLVAKQFCIIMHYVGSA